MDYSNGTTQQWDFDNRKRISRIRIGLTATPEDFIEDLNYTIDGNGNITQINENKYTYDGFHRISSAQTKLPEVPDFRKVVADHFGTYENGEDVEGKTYNGEADLFPILEKDGRINGEDYLQALIKLEEETAKGNLPFDYEDFSYDGNGNRKTLTQNGDEFIYTYGVRNQLDKIELQKEGTSSPVLYAEYTYDENGNTTKRTIHGEKATEIVKFEYDVINRLLKTTRGTETSEYLYDNAGNRVIKYSSDGALNLYLRHGTIAVAMDIEINSDTIEEKGKINRYVLSGDLVAGRITSTVKADNSTEIEKNYYNLDHLNSTKVVTDENGEVVVNYTYRAFGEQLKKLDKSNEETDDLGKYSYGGKELDEDINLYYFNARFYDATTGRFINVDPIQDGTNWYVYCSNNPLNMVDPTGLSDVKETESEDDSGYVVTYMDESYIGEEGFEFSVLRKGSETWEQLEIGSKIGNGDIFQVSEKAASLMEIEMEGGNFNSFFTFDAVDGKTNFYSPGLLDAISLQNILAQQKFGPKERMNDRIIMTGEAATCAGAASLFLPIPDWASKAVGGLTAAVGVATVAGGKLLQKGVRNERQDYLQSLNGMRSGPNQDMIRRFFELTK